MSYGTSGDDYYGGQADENIVVFKGKSLYPVIDEQTGVTTWYERKGDGLLDAFRNDIKLGSVDPKTGKFTPHEGTQLGALWPDGFSDVLVGDDAKEFLSDDFQKQLKKKAGEIVSKEEVEEKGNDPDTAETIKDELLDSGQARETTKDTLAAEQRAEEALANTNIQAVEGTRKSFGNLRYPKDMNGSQDYIQFSMLEYKPKDLLGSGLGVGDRARVGFNEDGGGRNIIGTCALPIQSGIKDQNLADWGENRMNALEMAGAKIALGALGDEQQGDAIGKVADAVSKNTGVAKEAARQYFTGKMVGVRGILARTKGATLNPNLELLFNGPLLRPFSFQFRLSARNKTEAEEIIKIIRFFKQGMAPIRTEGNLFLLAPHTFQVHYVHAPSDGEHPYIGKMKECALKTFSTDYTPENNYTTLRDGFMTSYTMTMEFQELEPVYNDDYTNLDGNADTQIGF